MENIRDEIAVRALHGLLVNKPLDYSLVAKDAYAIADEFIRARQHRYDNKGVVIPVKTDKNYCPHCGTQMKVDQNVCSTCREPICS